MGDAGDFFDVVCIGGAIIGSAAAYLLSESSDFDGSALVVEPDWTYGKSSTIRAGASEYRTIDMSSLGCERVLRNEPFFELAVI